LLIADNDADYKHYGYIGGTSVGDSLTKIDTIVEKPGSKEASPSSLASVSSYVFNPSIFKSIHEVEKEHDANEELSLQKAIQTA